MGDHQFRQQQYETSTTTVTTSGPQYIVEPIRLSINWPHLWSLSGILTFIELAMACLVLACIASARYEALGVGFIYFTAITSLIYSVVRISVYVFNIPQNSPDAIPWMLISLVLHATYAVFWFISGSLCWGAVDLYKHRTWNNARGYYGAAGFFCWVAWLIMTFRCLFFYFAMRNGHVEEVYGLPKHIFNRPPPENVQARQETVFTRT